MQLDFGVVLERWPQLAWGTLGTIWLALAGMTLALAIGIAGVAVLLASINVFGGFLVTRRMLNMFQKG